MKKLLFIATGGTIASSDCGNGLSPSMGAGRLLEGIDLPKTGVQINTICPFSLDSTNMTPRHWAQLAVLLRDSWREYDGFVVSHGTDTMAYGAAALFCLVQNPDKPIILTGSQLPMGSVGGDAERNLRDAFLCAERGKAGVWVCFCGRVIRGCSARKVDTRGLDAFRGFTAQDETDVRGFCEEAEGKPGGAVFFNRLDPSVAVLKLVPGISAEAVYDFGVHFNALVIEGFGMGGIPDYGGGELVRAAETLVGCGVRVIMATQVFAGGIDLSVYEVGRLFGNT